MHTTCTRAHTCAPQARCADEWLPVAGHGWSCCRRLALVCTIIVRRVIQFANCRNLDGSLCNCSARATREQGTVRMHRGLKSSAAAHGHLIGTHTRWVRAVRLHSSGSFVPIPRPNSSKGVRSQWSGMGLCVWWRSLTRNSLPLYFRRVWDP